MFAFGLFAFIRKFCPLSNEDPHVGIRLPVPPMPYRHFRNEAFLWAFGLLFGEYSDVIRGAPLAMIPYPRERARRTKDTEAIRARYRNTARI